MLRVLQKKMKKKRNESSKKLSVGKILFKGTDGQRKALFSFTDNPDEEIRVKFNLWARFFFPRFFGSPDAPFHKEIDLGNIGVYRRGGRFLNIAFRGSAKTTRTKLFIAFA